MRESWRTLRLPAPLERRPGVRERSHVVHVKRDIPDRELGPVGHAIREDVV